MPYLIDANCFIEPKNRYYDFDICPGFWDWLDQQNKLGVVFSIDQIGAELARGNDQLAQWAKGKDSNFFLPMDSNTASSIGQIGAWLTNSPTFEQHEVARFMKSADPFLIAYGLAHNHTIVTHEVHHPNQKKIKIPTICQQFKIQYVTIFDLLRSTKAKLVLHK